MEVIGMNKQMENEPRTCEELVPGTEEGIPLLMNAEQYLCHSNIWAEEELNSREVTKGGKDIQSRGQSLLYKGIKRKRRKCSWKA